jgi:hypothetical protein
MRLSVSYVAPPTDAYAPSPKQNNRPDPERVVQRAWTYLRVARTAVPYAQISVHVVPSSKTSYLLRCWSSSS